MRQKAYRHIHGRIANGTLSVGTVVSELSLAEEIGMSRTPIREAIRQLQVEGLVEQIPRFGTVVRRPRRREIVESYQLREALESYAVSLATEYISASDLATLEKLCDRIETTAQELKDSSKDSLDTDMLRKFLAADMAFHTVLIRAAGNSRIMKIINEMHVLTRIFGVERQAHDQDLVDEALQMHRQILEAIKNDSGDNARLAMARHIRTSMKQTLENYDQKLAESEGSAAVSLTLPENVVAELGMIESELETEIDE
ncbi:MAG: GntR family transcriptional regulator [Pirellulales bacterium]|nr:GntR family transcriptional regulator [Pirellulales bacterium]